MGSQIPQEKNKSPVGEKQGGAWGRDGEEDGKKREILKKKCAQSNKASWDM